MRRIVLGVLVSVLAALPLSASAYNYPGFKWAVNTVGFDTAPLSVPAWRSAATEAMNNWNNAGARFVMVNYAGSQNTMSYYWANSTTLASTHRYLRYGFWGDIYRATVKINNYHRFNPPYTSGNWYHLPSIMRHELGHAIPLDHVANSGSVMYGSFDPWQVKNLGSDEVNGIRAIYGVR